MAINFIDLSAQRERIQSDIDKRIAKVLGEGRYIMGPEVVELEATLADFANAKHALTCANGTDALILPMMAWEIGPGDAVFCPSFTYCASAEAIALLGATPIFVDIDPETYNMCPASLRRAIEDVEAAGSYTPRAVMTVDLFGQSANYPDLAPIAKKHGLKIIADSAQGFGTTLHGHHPLHWSDVATTSFYPAKPLGCYGDGGALLTNDDNLAEAITSLRNHGQGVDKYDNVRVGLNSRLDTIQAAILLAKLEIFQGELEARQHIAERYCTALGNYALRVPRLLDGATSSWAQFTIEVDTPDQFAAILKNSGIPTARYYPKPIHLQSAYKHCPQASPGLPHTEAAMTKVISLPMHAYLETETQDKIIKACQSALS